MNWHHFQAFIWLRWRLTLNGFKRSGPLSAIVEAILTVAAVAGAVVTFAIGLFIGMLALRTATPGAIMLVWDAAAAAFLFMWMAELIIELQRSEILSLDKFMHLPVSLSSAFLINYAASFVGLAINIFVPAMFGLALGLVLARGSVMLSMFPLVAAFFFVVTAITHQFRGWLASLMENKRKRRTIITMVTLTFVMLSQLPSILAWSRAPSNTTSRAIQREIGKVDRLMAERKITGDEYLRQTGEIYKKYGLKRPDYTPRARLADAQRLATIVNTAVPAGWLPYGAMALSDGKILPALLCMGGMVLIGAGSLRRSYQTTRRLYSGDFTSKKPRTTGSGSLQQTQPASSASLGKPSAAFLERSLPLISEHASAITFACLRSLIRAPESKMMLATPVIFAFLYASILRFRDPSEIARPFLAATAMAMVLFGLMQLAGNQFGLDRNGFRVFVLAPAARRDILLAKNLTLLPFAMSLGTLAVLAVEVLYPMRIDRLIAAWLQTIPMYLMFCITTNFLSILAPMPLPSGSLKPAKPKGMAVLIHLGFFVLFPLSMGLMLIPYGIEYLLHAMDTVQTIPVYFLLMLPETAVMLYIFPRILDLQGRLLQSREQKILDVVTSKVD